MSILVNYEERVNRLSLSGDLIPIQRSQLARAFVREHTGEFLSEQNLVIPCTLDDLPRTYRSLTKICESVNLNIEEAEALSTTMKEVRNEEAHFEEFSRLAEEIWHGKIEPTGLKEFTDIVSKHCPGRKLYPLQLLSAFHLAFSQHGCNFLGSWIWKDDDRVNRFRVFEGAFGCTQTGRPLVDPGTVVSIQCLGGGIYCSFRSKSKSKKNFGSGTCQRETLVPSRAETHGRRH